MFTRWLVHLAHRSADSVKNRCAASGLRYETTDCTTRLFQLSLSGERSICWRTDCQSLGSYIGASLTCQTPRQFRFGSRLRWSPICAAGWCAIILSVDITASMSSPFSSSPVSPDSETDFGGSLAAGACAHPTSSERPAATALASAVKRECRPLRMPLV